MSNKRKNVPEPESVTGFGQTINTESNEPKRAGRQKKDEEKAYTEYVSRIEKRIASGEVKKDNTPLEVLSRDDWDKKGQPSGETPQEKAVRLGEKRLNKAVEAISLIENLASSQYSFSEKQISKINEVLQKSVDKVKKSFEKVTEVTEKISLTD